MQIQIRPMLPDDAEAVTILSCQLGYQLSIHQTISHINDVLLRPDHCVFVATEQNKIIGWVHAFKAIRIESPPFIEIAGLVADENHRGRGIGKSLVNEVIEWSKEKAIATLRVRCNTKRTDAHQFYRRLRFGESKEQKIFELRM